MAFPPPKDKSGAPPAFSKQKGKGKRPFGKGKQTPATKSLRQGRSFGGSR
jgi:hypothetical protein